MHNLFSLSLSLSNAEGMQAGAMYSMYAGDAYVLLRFATAVQKCTGKPVYPDAACVVNVCCCCVC